MADQIHDEQSYHLELIPHKLPHSGTQNQSNQEQEVAYKQGMLTLDYCFMVHRPWMLITLAIFRNGKTSQLYTLDLVKSKHDRSHRDKAKKHCIHSIDNHYTHQSKHQIN